MARDAVGIRLFGHQIWYRPNRISLNLGDAVATPLREVHDVRVRRVGGHAPRLATGDSEMFKASPLASEESNECAAEDAPHMCVLRRLACDG